MLKRQRSTFIHPSALDEPGFLNVNDVQLSSKRPRTMPPSFDLHPEASNAHSSCIISDDDSEEYIPVIRDSGDSKQVVSHEYKSSNSILHEMHILNQHRRLFSSPSQQDTSAPSAPSQYPPTLSAIGAYVDKRERVAWSYEDSNRLLGSAVLSRRRQLDGDS